MKKLEFIENGNMGGISRMFAIPLSSFKRIRRDYTNNKNYLEVINRDDIIDIYFTEDTDTFQEDYEDGLYNVQLGGSTPKSNPINRDQLKRLDTDLWLVLFQDNNDYVRLAGMKDYPLEFRRTDITGQIGTRNQISFMFYGAQIEACEFIELAEMDDL